MLEYSVQGKSVKYRLYRNESDAAKSLFATVSCLSPSSPVFQWRLLQRPRTPSHASEKDSHQAAEASRRLLPLLTPSESLRPTFRGGSLQARRLWDTN